MRGPAPSGQCPRCDELQPAGDQRMTTCVTCGLRFDALAPPRARPPRRSSARAADPAPPGVTVEPDRLLLPRQPWSGFATLAVVVLFVGLAIHAVADGDVSFAGEYLGLTIVVLAAVIRLPLAIHLLAGRRTITVDAGGLVAETIPFARTRVELARDRIARVTVAPTRRYRDRGVYGWHVNAHVDGADRLVVRAEDEEMARFIATWLQDKLAIVDDELAALLDASTRAG